MVSITSLRGRGGDRVLSGLEALGYACWPVVVGAVHAGAGHRRKRVWIVAHLAEDGGEQRRHEVRAWQSDDVARVHQAPTDTDCVREREPARREHEERLRAEHDAKFAADAALAGLEVAQPGQPCAESTPALGNAGRPTLSGLVRVVHGISDRMDEPAGLDEAEALPWWPIGEEPPIARTARNVRNRVDRISALGNAVVPEVAAMIGRAILVVEASLMVDPSDA